MDWHAWKNMNGKHRTLYINYLQLWCDYRIDGYSLKNCVMFSSFSNTYPNLKVPINQYVNQLNNVKVTVCWQAYYHLGSCSSSFCPPQSCILFPIAPEPAKAVDPAKETEELRYLFLPRINMRNFKEAVMDFLHVDVFLFHLTRPYVLKFLPAIRALQRTNYQLLFTET